MRSRLPYVLTSVCSRWIVSGCLLASMLGAAAGAAAPTAFGAIAGRIVDSYEEPLVAAEILIRGTSRTTKTDITGRYTLPSLPVGPYVLEVRYLGFPSAELSVKVNENATTAGDVVLASFGDTISVSALPILSGQARALNQQRNSISITNVVSATQIGRFPDPNAAEAGQRIAGVHVLRDQGEGRFLQVRGTETRLNSMTINGERIPSPNGEGRDVALDTIPSDLLGAIEVYKSLRPDMDGDAIGGVINLVTHGAPDRRQVAGAFGAGRADLVKDDIRDANVTYGDRFGSDDKHGLLLTASSRETNRGSDNIEPEYDDGELEELQLRDYTVERRRLGFGATLDYRPKASSEFFFNAFHTDFDDQEIRRRKRERVGDDAIERDIKDRLEEQNITSVRAGGSHLLASSWLLDYRLSWSSSSEDELGRIDSVFVQEDVLFDPNVDAGTIDPRNIRANPLNEDIGQFVLDELVREDNTADEEDLVAAVDLSFPFSRSDGLSGLWKTGIKMRFKEKERDTNVFELDLDDDLAITDVLSPWRSETPFFGGQYDIGPFQRPGALRDLAARLPAERDLESDLEDYRADEDTVAAYGMVELYREQLTFLGGVRYERTETSFAAFELVDGNDVLTPVSDSSSYDELLPMLHLRYRPDEDSAFRVALTRSLARPDFEDLAPFLFQEDDERQRGNPNLDVTTAWNMDLMYERYLSPAGVISAGLFFKRLSDNIFVFTFEEEDGGETFDVTQPRNGDSADLYGLELAYQTRFHQLPPPFDGLGIYFNYTFAESEADFEARRDLRLMGQADQLGNFALSYEKGGFSGQVSLNYRSEFLIEVGESSAKDIFVDDHFQVDLTFQQELTDGLRLYLEVINLSDEPYRVYEGSPERPVQEDVYSWWGTIGLKWKL